MTQLPLGLAVEKQRKPRFLYQELVKVALMLELSFAFAKRTVERNGLLSVSYPEPPRITRPKLLQVRSVLGGA